MPVRVYGTGGGKNTKDATAVPADVMNGKTFYGADGKQTGNYIPPITLEDCTNITVLSKTDGIEISWTDPENVIFDGDITAEWKGTKLIRKTGSYPTSETDGTLVLNSNVRNAYSTTPFKDTDLQADTMYYYCLFPYTDKSVTKSDDNRFAAEILHVDPVLGNNSWEKIALASEMGIASQLWQIGDEIDIELCGTFNETVTLQIWDFKHFDKADGSGKAGICFGMKNLMSIYKQMNSYDTNSGGWNNIYMRNTVMQQILSSMPASLQAIIKEVNTYANQGGGNSSSSGGKLCTDKVFLPGARELFGSSWSSQSNTESNQVQFPLFTDTNSRIKKMSNGSGSADYYWLRSPDYYYNSYFCYVNTSGGGNTHGASYSHGVCFCFCV